MHRPLATVLAVSLAAAPAAGAGDKRFTLSTVPGPAEDGALRHILPRFSLKTGVKVEVIVSEAPVAGDGLALTTGRPEGTTPVMVSRDGEVLSAATGEDPDAARFLDWLTSEVGRRTIASFKPGGEPLYLPPEEEIVVEEAPEPDGDAALGEQVSLRSCGRCHVINEKNKYGGIGSTPSFGALRSLSKWYDSFSAFWTINPHPAFTQVAGVTPPFDPARPSPIAPVELTLEEVEAIVAFVSAMPPKDLGAPVAAR